jgi:hypothetical protein
MVSKLRLEALRDEGLRRSRADHSPKEPVLWHRMLHRDGYAASASQARLACMRLISNSMAGY